MKVVVLGAGVVGCATAYELARRGDDVTLLDAAAGPGTGTSFANGGQLSYSFVEPLASPATLRALPRWLLDPASPVRFVPRPDPAQWAWGLRFLAACTAARSEAGTRALLTLALRSRGTLEAWLAHEPLAFGHAGTGKLVLCPDADSLAAQERQVARQAFAGVPQAVLSRAECIAREPVLAAYPGFVGGVWTASECVGDPYLYCEALVAALRARGGVCRFGVRARGFVVRRGRAVAVTLEGGQPVTADAFVLACGLGSAGLARTLGERLPLHPVKGYSLTLDVQAGRALPRTSVTDLGRKMVLAPLGGQLRVAALAELTGDDLSIPRRAIDAIAASVEAVYPGLCRFDEPRAWAGLRPATPDSLPLLRRSRVPNVVLNTGHGALGFTLAAGSASVVAELLHGERIPARAAGFAPSPACGRGGFDFTSSSVDTANRSAMQTPAPPAPSRPACSSPTASSTRRAP